MATNHTDLPDVADQIVKYWGPQFDSELRESFVLPALINRTPGGLAQIREGDTVRVSQVNQLAGSLSDIQATCTFETETLTTQYVDIVCDRRAYAALSFCDLVELKSQINMQRQDVRMAMAHGMNKQINDFVYSKVSCTIDNNSTATLDADVLTTLTKQADEAFWPEGNRWLLVDPCYHKDILDDATLTNLDFGATDAPVIGGRVVLRRYGWNIVMDNSAAMKDNLNASAAGVGLAFTPDFMAYLNGYQSRVKVSDAHSSCEWRFRMTVDTVFGAGLLNDGADKCITVRTGA